MKPSRLKTGLILSGGGARAAFQVGVLKAISEILPFTTHENPFPIITGTSAGAINATVVAAYSQHFRLGMKRLENVWANFHCDQVFYSDFRRLTLHQMKIIKVLFGGSMNRTFGMLDNTPLAALLEKVIPFPLIEKAISQGALDALCVTASSYTSGESISFFQADADTHTWNRQRRRGHSTIITKLHLLASAAIPLVFPAVRVGNQYFGDGSMRFLAPLSPAVHLGAERILVVGVDPINQCSAAFSHPEGEPSVAEIAGHVLDSVFIDSLDSDLERLQRVNKTIDKIPQKLRNKDFNLRQIETLAINPSKDITLIAGEHFDDMPKALKFFLKRMGIDGDSGAAVLSYLLFERPFTRELIQLGYNDAMAMADEILSFYKIDD